MAGKRPRARSGAPSARKGHPRYLQAFSNRIPSTMPTKLLVSLDTSWTTRRTLSYGRCQRFAKQKCGPSRSAPPCSASCWGLRDLVSGRVRAFPGQALPYRAFERGEPTRVHADARMLSTQEHEPPRVGRSEPGIAYATAVFDGRCSGSGSAWMFAALQQRLCE